MTNTYQSNVNSAAYRADQRPRPRICDMCREVPAEVHVWAPARDGAIVTADVCRYCRDRGGWKGGR